MTIVSSDSSVERSPKEAGPGGYIVCEYFSRLKASYEIIWETKRGPFVENVLDGWATKIEPGKIEPGKIEPGKIEPGKIEPGKIERQGDTK